MKLLRSWPTHIPEGRSYVVDAIPRLLMSQLDYRPPLEAMEPDDVLLIEWDIAVGKHELLVFAERARDSPEQILVAPYRIYRGEKYSDLGQDMWAHRHWDGTADPPGSTFPRFGGWQPVMTGEPTANLFGFGLIYLPRELISAFMASNFSNLFGDAQFGMWHYTNVAKEVPIAWECPAVHLNYEIEVEGAPFCP